MRARTAIPGLCVALAVWAAAPARAAGEERAALRLEGLYGEGVRSALIQTIVATMPLVAQEDLSQAIEARSQGGTVGPSSAGEVPQVLRYAAQDVRASVLVFGRAKGQRAMRLVIMDVATDRVVSDEIVSLGNARRGRRFARRVDASAATRVVARALQRLQRDTTLSRPPQLPAGDTVARLPPESGAAPEGESVSSRRAVGELTVAAGLGGRRLTYRDPVTSNLRGYSLLGAPVLRVGGLFHLPTDLAVLEDVAIEAEYGRGVGLRSSTSVGPSPRIPTTQTEWGLGARLRLPVEAFTLAVGASYGQLAFAFGAPEDEDLPAVGYRFVRAGFAARVPASDFDVLLAAGYLHLLSSGHLGDELFPRSREAGLEARAGAATPLWRTLEAQVLVRYTRMFYDIRPEVGDTHVAGGALDQFFTLELRLTQTF